MYESVNKCVRANEACKLVQLKGDRERARV